MASNAMRLGCQRKVAIATSVYYPVGLNMCLPVCMRLEYANPSHVFAGDELLGEDVLWCNAQPTQMIMRGGNHSRWPTEIRDRIRVANIGRRHCLHWIADPHFSRRLSTAN